MRQKIPMPDMGWLYGQGSGGLGLSLHERAAKALGWTVKETQSFSLQSLRDAVQAFGKDPGLVHDMTSEIRSGRYIRGTRR